MPSLQLRWWNLAGGGQAKADAAINLLNGWGGAPAGVGLPAPAAPLGGAPFLSATCEINGNLFVVPAGLGRGWANVTASPTAGRWVAAKHRTQLAKRQRQKGYYGAVLGPLRFDTGVGGAWAGGAAWGVPAAGGPAWAGVGQLQTRWSNYPGQLGGVAMVAPAPVVNRPNATAVRSRNTRRELVVTTIAPAGAANGLIVAWYHAISGQGPATVYDLYEVLDWLITLANQEAIAGRAQHVILLGDLNLDPGNFQDYFDGLLNGAGLTFAGNGANLQIQPDEYGVVHSGTPTQSGGHELDYAIVMNWDSLAHPGAVAASRGFIECGQLVAGPALGGPAPAGPPAVGAFPQVFGAYQTDHRPIKLQLDY